MRLAAGAVFLGLAAGAEAPRPEFYYEHEFAEAFNLWAETHQSRWEQVGAGGVHVREEAQWKALKKAWGKLESHGNREYE